MLINATFRVAVFVLWTIEQCGISCGTPCIYKTQSTTVKFHRIQLRLRPGQNGRLQYTSTPVSTQTPQPCIVPVTLTKVHTYILKLNKVIAHASPSQPGSKVFIDGIKQQMHIQKQKQRVAVHSKKKTVRTFTNAWLIM